MGAPQRECKICKNTSFSNVFSGKIRDGKFGNFTKESHNVLGCANCGAQFLEDKGYSAKEFYESSDYRESVNSAPDVVSYQNNHDWEQIRHLMMAGTRDVRNKTIMDIGCGAGSFLDFMSGTASEVFAVEPHEVYKKHLKSRGYSTYSYANDLFKEKGSCVDRAFCFSVIEHIDDPLPFLSDIYNCLSEKGTLTISTPNTDDILIDMLPEEYKPFYYRIVHEWYFNQGSLKFLLEKAGFKNVKVKPFQRFGFSNFTNWLVHRKPCGDEQLEYIPVSIENSWKTQVESEFKSDYLYAIATK